MCYPEISRSKLSNALYGSQNGAITGKLWALEVKHPAVYISDACRLPTRLLYHGQRTLLHALHMQLHAHVVARMCQNVLLYFCIKLPSKGDVQKCYDGWLGMINECLHKGRLTPNLSKGLNGVDDD